MNCFSRYRISLAIFALGIVAIASQRAAAQSACCLPSGNCQVLIEDECFAVAGAPQDDATCNFISCKPHIVLGVCGGEPTGGDVDACPNGNGASLKLFEASNVQGIAGDGPGVPMGAIIPVRRVDLGSTSGPNIYRLPEFGGYSYATRSLADIGTDYATAPYFPALNKLPGSVFSYEIRTERINYSHPADFAYYSVFGLPLMVNDGDSGFFGDQGDAHFHPFWLMRRPGQVSWTFRYTSNVAFEDSDPITHVWTSVPGRGEFVPFDMSSVFNADLVDSDNSDSPRSFDEQGNHWVLNGQYGTDAGLPIDGRLDEFQLGGTDGTLLGGSFANALYGDNNFSFSLAAVIDLAANGQADQYLSVEFLIGAAGGLSEISSDDAINVTLHYADGTQQVVAIKRRFQDTWTDYQMLTDWEQTQAPNRILAVGPLGDNTTGFARSNGSGIDIAAGENFYLFRAHTVTFDSKVLNSIEINNPDVEFNIAIFAMTGIKQAPLEIVTDSLPEAVEGQPYSVMIDALGTPPFKNWTASGLPAGLELSFTGEIVGTPAAGAASGSPYQVTIDVEDSINDFDANYPPEMATTMLTLTVTAGSSPADVDDDGDVDLTDAQLLSGVLVGNITEMADPVVFERSDINGDEMRDGNDIAAFLAELGD